MFKQKFKEKTKKQKILTALCAFVLIFLSLALVLGILNALFADGEWTLWSSYRYDETGYSVGSSTVPSDRITSIDVDWIDGSVELVVCQDALLSITEQAEGELAENAKLRWSLGADRSVFSVKYRKSAAFLGFGGGGDGKKLTVRIPETMLEQLASVKVNAKDASVRLDGIAAESLAITTHSGAVTLAGGTYKDIAVSTRSGEIKADTAAGGILSFTSRKGSVTLSDAVNAVAITLASEEGSVELSLPEPTGFALFLSCEAGKFVTDRALIPIETGYAYGDGGTRVSLSSEEGAVRLYTRK